MFKNRLLHLVLLFIIWTGSVHAQPCLTGWSYRVPIDITSTANLTDFQVEITAVDLQALVTASKLQNDWDDLRFYDGSGTELAYWVEEADKVWVKVPSVASGSTTIYMFYGNNMANATAYASGDSTFEFFDGFDGVSLDASKWNTCQTGGSASLASSVLTLTISDTEQQGLVSTNPLASTSVRTVMKVNSVSASKNKTYLGLVNDVANNGYAMVFEDDGADTISSSALSLSANCPTFTNLTGSNDTARLVTTIVGNWELAWGGASSQSFTWPDATVDMNDATVTPANLKVALGVADSASTSEIDWVLVRKYTASDPTSSAGAEVVVSADVNLSANANPLCEDVDLILTVANVLGATYNWDGPHSSLPMNSSSDSSITINVADADDGDYSVSITINGCTTDRDTVNVTVNPLPTVTLSDFTAVCIDATAFALSGGSPSGGTYSGTGVSGGNFDPSVAGDGTHSITYTYTDGNGCTSTASKDIVVNLLPTVTLSDFTAVCVDATPFTLSGGSPSGGTYSGTGVSGGNFDPSVAGDGTHSITYTYTDGNGCTSTASKDIVVNLLPTVTLSDFTAVCVDATAFALSGGSPSGGTYSGTGVSGGNFDPSVAGDGTHSITYSYTNGNGCTSTASKDIVVNLLPTVTLSDFTAVCVDATPFALSGGSPSGGTYSGTGVSGGNFDPSVAGDGTHSITYTYTDGNGCTSTASKDIVVNLLPTVTLSDFTAVCIDATAFALSGGSPSGGTYSGTGVSGGNFDPSVAGDGTHSITYSYTNGNGCTSTASKDIVVNLLPTVTLSDFTAVCIDATPFALSGGSPSGGTYSGTGVSGGNFDPSVAGDGTHTITYTYTNGNGCTNSASKNITVNSLTGVTLNNFNPVCLDAAAFPLSGGSPSGGTYSGVGVNAGNFDPSVAGDGTHSITYTYIDGNGCTNSAAKSITVNALISVTLNDFNPVCVDATPFALSGGSPTGGSYSGTGVSGGTFDPSVAGDGTHTITYTYTDGNGCTNSASKNIMVNALLSVTLNDFNPVCVDAAPVVLSGGSPIGGTFSGTGVSGGSFDPSVTGTGTYTITYTYTDGNGCSNSASKNITVNGLPSVTLGNFSPVCVDATPFALSGGSPSGGVFSGLGVSGGTFDPSVAGDGTHSITYTYTDGNGCTNSESRNIIVNGLPSVTLTDFSAVCIDAPAFMLSGGSPAGGSYSGTGVNAGSFDPSVAGDGTHSITYTYTDGNGCTNSASKNITVNSLPTVTLADFNPVCVNEPIFALSGVSPTGGTFSGLGVNAGNFDPSVAGDGAHSITYTYTDANGCVNSTSKSITVNATADAGTLSPSLDSVCISDAVSRNITISNSSGSISRWQESTDAFAWVDIPNTSGQTTLAYSGNSLGSAGNIYYRTIVSSGACPNAATDHIRITVSPNTVEGSIPQDISVCKSDSSDRTIQLTGNLGRVLRWEKLNGTTNNWESTANNSVDSTMLIYQGVNLPVGIGQYRAVVQSGVCVATNTNAVAITVRSTPNTNFTIPTAECQGVPIDFNVPLNDNDITYNWNFETGSSSSELSTSHTYSNLGIQTVTLAATINGVGCTDTTAKEITINATPRANLTLVNNVCQGSPVIFKNDSDIDSPGAISQYLWNFGVQGSTVQIADTTRQSFTYNILGSYTVTLSASTDEGCSHTVDTSITVLPKPDVAFQADNTCAESPVLFTNQTTVTGGEDMTYEWLIDGLSIAETSPTYTYHIPGTKLIRLTAYTATGGCSANATQSIVIHPKPSTSFTTEDVCFGTSAAFTNNSTLSDQNGNPTGVMNHHWNMGDNTIFTTEDAAHDYASPNTYTVMLTITTDQGCVDADTQNITINYLPTANFDANPVCLDDSVRFRNISDILRGTITATWDMNDGNTLTDFEPVYKYNTDGSYNVRLIITSNADCADTTFQSVTVHPLPEPNFEVPAVCELVPSVFTNNSSINSGSIIESQWRFGDGANSFEENPEHTYAQYGSYPTKLTLLSDKGCRAYLTQNAIVHPKPLPDFSFNNVCFNTAMDFANLSDIPTGSVDSYMWHFGNSENSSETSPSRTYASAGRFDVELVATSDFGCQDSVMKTVEVYQLPDVQVSRDTTLSKGYSTQLLVTGGEDYVWFPETGLDDASIADPIATPLNSQVYTVTVTDSNSCQNTEQVSIEIIEDFQLFISNIITPNGNGQNDTWVVENIGTYAASQVVVYDMWGKEVLNKRSYQNDWDGTNGSKPLPDGTYYYYVKFDNSSKVYKGALTILRN